MKSRAVSAPYRSISVDGSTTFRFDLDIFIDRRRRPSRRTGVHFPVRRPPPDTSSRASGPRRSACRPFPGKAGARTARSLGRAPLFAEVLVEEPGVDEVHAGAPVPRPPTYWSTGANRRIFSGSSRRAVVFRVDVTAEKYQEDSTKVSNVSVSRRPGFLQIGHGTRSHCSAPARGFPRSRVYGRSSGKHHRKILLRNGDDAARLAVDHRDRTTPVPLPADPPIAKPVLDRPAAHPLPFKVKCDRPLPLFARDPVERAGAYQAPRPLVRRGHRRGIERLPLGLHDDHDRAGLYVRANSKSRWSWAGTAITAPVP